MDEETDVLKEELEQLNEDLFLSQNDLEFTRTENVALKSFIQNLYDSCQELEETELSLQEVLKNLKENIRLFSRENRIRL